MQNTQKALECVDFCKQLSYALNFSIWRNLRVKAIKRAVRPAYIVRPSLKK
jgi:hypothetical protein